MFVDTGESYPSSTVAVDTRKRQPISSVGVDKGHSQTRSSLFGDTMQSHAGSSIPVVVGKSQVISTMSLGCTIFELKQNVLSSFPY